MPPNGQNNIKNEFHIPELVEIEVLHVYMVDSHERASFGLTGGSKINIGI